MTTPFTHKIIVMLCNNDNFYIIVSSKLLPSWCFKTHTYAHPRTHVLSNVTVLSHILLYYEFSNPWRLIIKFGEKGKCRGIDHPHHKRCLLLEIGHVLVELNVDPDLVILFVN